MQCLDDELIAGNMGTKRRSAIIYPDMLADARAHPGKYPDIVVRVAGFCAYFDDLPDSVKKEIIDRTRIAA
ncbi:MAG: glycine radical domain-containing protein [Thermodesulfobacteriota bacterium]